MDHVFTVIDAPRLGPYTDPGPVTSVAGIGTTFKLWAGNVTDKAITAGDKYFIGPDCSAAVPTANTASTSTLYTIGTPGGTHHETTFVAPTTLSTGVVAGVASAAGYTQLKVCFATKEMNDEYSATADSFTVIQMPQMAGGINSYSVSGTSPDYYITGASDSSTFGVGGGDRIYLRATCAGPDVSAHTTVTTAPISLREYNISPLGPMCSQLYAALATSVVYSASSHMLADCGDVRYSAGTSSPTGWCSQWTGQEDKKGMEDGREEFAYTDADYDYQVSNARGNYLQLDVGSSVKLSALDTKGRGDAYQWVTSYAISTSVDGVSWTEYKVNNVLKVFAGNANRDMLQTHDISGSHLIARYVRVYPKSWYGAMSMRMDLKVCYGGVKLFLPSSPALTSLSSSAGRPLKICYATRRSEQLTSCYATLAQTHTVQPTTMYVKAAMLPRGEIATLTPWLSPFPTNAGDIIVLASKTHSTGANCAGVWSTAASFPGGPSGRIIMDSSGNASLAALSLARVNELNQGEYTMCFAPAASQGDTDADFYPLSTVAQIFYDARTPVLTTSAMTATGSSIAVAWTANRGLSNRLSHTMDWIGLFKKGECEQPKYDVDDASVALSADVVPPYQQNECYLQWRALPGSQVGGTVQFAGVQEAGEYEARYFLGDSQHGQGMVCRTLQGTVQGGEHYRFCAREAAAVSGSIVVTAGSDVIVGEGNVREDPITATVPGLERSFHAPSGFGG
jgi:hypothetical protein